MNSTTAELPLKDRLLRVALQVAASSCLYFAIVFVDEDRPKDAMLCGAVLWCLVELWRCRFGGSEAPTRTWAERVVARVRASSEK